MILLIWSSERAIDCAKAIEQSFQAPVRIVSTLHQACDWIQREEYSAVLVDQSITEVNPSEADFLIHHLGAAVLVFVNFGISGVERILRELRAAFSRHSRETMRAHQLARTALRNELKDDVTALLLSCGIALSDPNLNEAAVTRLKVIEEVANRVKDRLTSAELCAPAEMAMACAQATAGGHQS